MEALRFGISIAGEKGDVAMSDRDLEELEEYDSRLLDATPFAQSTPATNRYQRESLESAAEAESPFLLGNSGEMPAEMEGLTWQRSRRSSAPRVPRRTGRAAPPPPPNCNCDCHNSTADSAPADPAASGTDEYGESEYLQEQESETETENALDVEPAWALEPQTEGLVRHRGGRTSTPKRPKFRPGRPAPPRPSGCNCNCNGSTGDSVSGDADEYGESEDLEGPESEAIRVTAPEEELVPFSSEFPQYGTFPADVVAAAQASQATWNIPASITLAQWSLESDFGRSMPAGSNNPFGIKAIPGDPYVEAKTREVKNGKDVTLVARFRKFASMKEAFDRHGSLLANQKQYELARTHINDPDAFADALTGIYATDRSYGANLKRRMKMYNLYQYDSIPSGAESRESFVDEVELSELPGESFEFDPYADMRAALSPEHANLPADEVTVVLGRMPATLVLHQLVNSPEMRQATLASLLGDTGRRSVHLNGSDVSIPAYLRMVSRLCREVAERSETEFEGGAQQQPVRVGGVCPPRDRGEKTKSFFGSPKVVFSKSSQELLIQGFPVGSKNMAGDFPNVPAWQEAMSLIAGDPNAKATVTGFTDCAGSDQENRQLQQQRADLVKAQMPALVQARVIATGSAGTASFPAGNSTAAERASNRAVRVKFLSSPPASEGPFDRLVNGSKTLDEYLFLVRSLEQRLGLAAPEDAAKALSVLRQIYYGPASWTLNQNQVWNKIIVTSAWPSGDDPTPKLTQPLMQALQKSQTVEGVDLGHVFTGLDAMTNPQQISVHRFTTSLNNEEVATWSGDVGSAAAEWAVDAYYGRTVLKAKGKPVGSSDDYFKGFAGADDLHGDIDAYAMRAGFSPGATPKPLVMSAIKLLRPLSESLLQYYRLARTDQGRAHNQRFKIFVESFGGVVKGNSLTNPQALIEVLQPKVAVFASAFALTKPLGEHHADYGERTVPPGDPRELNQILADASAHMTNRFVTFLARGVEQRL